jgi:hypothetical protein
MTLPALGGNTQIRIVKGAIYKSSTDSRVPLTQTPYLPISSTNAHRRLTIIQKNEHFSMKSGSTNLI